MTASTTAARPLRVGAVGAGAIARLSHLPSIAAVDGLEIAGVADPNLERAQELAHEYGAQGYSDYRDMFSQADLDVVLVAIPNHLHRQVIEDAAAAKIHVFCEKPVAHNLVDAIAIQEACERAGVRLQVGFNQRFWEPTQIAKRSLEAGVIGDVQGFRSVYSEAWDVYPAATGYRYNLQQSGGAAILDLGVHRIDIARYLLGEIIEVCATMDHRVIPHPADDNVFLLVRFASGATGVINSDRFSPQVAGSTDLYGPDGTIHLSTETINPFASVPLAISSKLPREELPREITEAYWPTAWWNEYQPGTWLEFTPPRTNPYVSEWRAFEASIRTGVDDAIAPTGIDGVKAQEVVTAAYRSVRTHGWVSLPLADPEEPIPSYE
ncbi:Gfo/Idh/MocA family protein [Leucobacter luti]|uniref:Putative dehydrogenase n=1 Tax=Leucobacter luti TaxID=340320 RepID=A0A4Q7U5G1_9MICO|nr:Gfo/Idh/MocA family oxidoreductase [Leucobacter luti]MBL3700776.1 gfo/Idh/MocA family oxidoreductase [Leucobacter luti]RZT68387.1 putative dehydrogenase [Leucobacter luti]